MLVEINRKNEKFTVIVDDDCELFKNNTWSLKKSGNKLYLRTAWYLGMFDNGEIRKPVYKHEYFHRIYTGAKKGQYVDHINGNTLDNRRENLRICTNAENCRNQRLSVRNKTGVKGVYINTKNKYTAQVSINGKTKNLGSFTTLQEAKEIRNKVELEIYGEFANIAV